MENNLGKIDRIIRALLALSIITLYFTTSLLSNVLGISLVFLACMLAFTSIIGVCPFYNTIGLSTAD